VAYQEKHQWAADGLSEEQKTDKNRGWSLSEERKTDKNSGNVGKTL